MDWLRDAANLRPALPDDVTIDTLLSEGGQGVVYRGAVGADPAAIKVYAPGQLQTRVEREIRALRELSCPSIVRLLWSGSIPFDGQDLPVVATELVPGASLDHVLETRALTSEELGILAFDVANAIEAMWSKRIVHRDLKPPNILIRHDGRSCVIDLGVARHLGLSALTTIGATWGTLGYMSPEQTRAVQQLTCKSDLFALGVILVEASLQRHPTNRDQLRLLTMRLDENLPAEIRDWEHSTVLRELLNPRPTRRPRPDAVLEALEDHAPP